MTAMQLHRPLPAPHAPRMNRVQPGSRFLLLGLPEAEAAAVAQGLRDAGAAVDRAPSGTAGRRLLQDQQYDVILLAIATGAPDSFTGIAFCRQQGLGAGLLAVVADSNARHVAPLIDAGADDCVTTPFDYDELLSRLCALARRVTGRVPVGRVLRTHDLEIDTATRTVRRGTRTIHLTRREYALLHLLAQHCGKVVTREMIREHVYGGCDLAGSNVVDVYIRYLRAKLDCDFDPPLILTRWGEGYLLRGDH